MIAVLGAVGWGGCSPNRQRLASAVLKADPSFASMLNKQRELSNQIDTYQRELALKRGAVERSIAQLRQDLAAATASVKGKVAEAQRQLDPERERLRLALSMATEELQLKRAQRASLGRSISRLKKTVQGSPTGWTAKERTRHDAQIQDMVDDTARLDREMTGLRSHLQLLKTKLLLLKL